MTYFSTDQAAVRYARFRPKVHDVVREWLAGFIDLPVPRALDVACGTGDSTQALIPIVDDVIGIDQSNDMLAQARAQNLTVHCLPYQQASSLGRFQLITTCMAFHWFDRDEAIEAYKQASEPGALWLNYNFAFAGSEHCEAFNRWFEQTYLTMFPTPKRNPPMAAIDQDAELEKLSEGEGELPIRLSRDALVGYLTTQSNIEAAVVAGQTYEQIESTLHQAFAEMPMDEHFRYRFHYELYRYQPC
ncbi:class I SAM-dependent methyltransferase [Reinekea blandensis]|uniref:Methyltransferase domain-containing protein n=1 Tax=Reinekea blandensis MED297 TaxID=314283 RepID=A4BCQ9_9GAMM|nr:class I SAM-dependent methyltransferase [Reinekea blandensis]EAR09991.1 hypothetical protein MED297_07881 [Reinekea sp. MED297] [Reinekea blandensis MED297]